MRPSSALKSSLLGSAVGSTSKQFDTSTMLRAVLGGLVSGFLVVFRAVSFSSVYFKGALLSPYISVCMQALLISSVVAQLCYMNHPVKACISCPSSTSVPFQAALVGGVVTAANGDAMLAVQGSLLMFVASSLAFGVSLQIIVSVCKPEYLEAFKCGFPQPVIYGFFTAVGLAMIQSSLKVVVGEDIIGSVTNDVSALVQCLFALACGLTNRFGTRAVSHYLVLPILLISELVLLHVVLAAAGVSLVEAREEGWLFASFPAHALSDLPSFYTPPSIDAMVALLPEGFATILSSMIVVLWVDLGAGSIVPMEATAGTELNMRSELQRGAATNIACGLTGGTISYMSLSPTRMNQDAGGGASRGSLVVCMLTCVAWLLWGQGLLEYVPKPWVAGMLLHLAFGYILEGCWDPLTILNFTECLVVATITVAYVLKGIVVSIVLGCILCCIYFTARYATSPVVVLPTDERSTKARTGAQTRLVKKLYEEKSILVVRSLCSQLFFGSAAAMTQAVKGITQPCTRFVIFDFESVVTVDASAVIAVGKLQSALGSDVDLIIANIKSAALLQQFRRSRDNGVIPSSTRVFEDLDLGLQWAEDACLNVVGEFHLKRTPLTQDALLQGLFDDDIAKLGNGLFVKLEAGCGESVFNEGTAARGMYIVAEGQLSLYRGSLRLHTAIRGDRGPDVSILRQVGPYRTPSSPLDRRLGGPEARRLQVLQPGDVICERAVYCPLVHSKSMVADEDGTKLLLLTRDKLLRLEHEDPKLAMRLHRYLALRATQSRVIDLVDSGAPAASNANRLAMPANGRGDAYGIPPMSI